MNEVEKIVEDVAQGIASQLYCSWVVLTEDQREGYRVKARLAIAAMPAPGVRVKPLVWTLVNGMRGDHSRWDADSILGNYRVVICPDGDVFLAGARAHRLTSAFDGGTDHKVNSLMEYAQADYERRILSAIDDQVAEHLEETA